MGDTYETEHGPESGPELDRLRAADPAGADPDLSALRARVLMDAADSPSTARTGRGRAIAVGIAAAVALLAAGTLAGVALGRATADDPILALESEPAELPAINSTPDLSREGVPVTPGMPSMAGSAMATEDAKASSMIWPGYSADVIADPNLDDEGGTADGYRLDVSGIDPIALASQLASVFGVEGSPTTNEGMVSVGDASGMGPQIWVYDDATASWAYSDYSRDPWNCPDASVSSESGVSEPMPAEPCTPSGAPISENAARDQAESILSSLGVSDGAGFGLDWETYSDGVITTATAWQTIDDQRTQLSWSVSFDATGPLWANGFAGGLEVVADYPIVGARTAVERSAQPKWAAFGPSPIDGGVRAMDSTVSSAEVSAEPAPRASAASAGSVQIIWDPVVATGASPTLAQYWTPQGEFLLLPAYRLTTADDRGDWVVIAVSEPAVTFTTGR